MAKKKEMPIWLKRSEKEIEEIVLKLAKEGMSNAKIGLVLRDSYGIPTAKITGKKISKILSEQGIKAESDLDALMKKAFTLKKHMEKNKQDKTAKKGLITIEARIMKLSRYMKKKGMLANTWKYKEQ